MGGACHRVKKLDKFAYYTVTPPAIIAAFFSHENEKRHTVPKIQLGVMVQVFSMLY